MTKQFFNLNILLKHSVCIYSAIHTVHTHTFTYRWTLPSSNSALCSFSQLLLVSLSFVYFAKTFVGSYMKSSITQIERRFDIPSSLIGIIDGSFEMGNLLVIAFVNYFGAKLHRPRLIGIVCLILAAGAFLTALECGFSKPPYHFIEETYISFLSHSGMYETTLSHTPEENTTKSILPCLSNTSHLVINDQATAASKAVCEKEAGSSMWIYVFLGNMLCGIGETPVMPLGVSYLDDYARKENTAIYLACLQTVGNLRPVFGFLFGSFCAKIYVDIGSVDLVSVFLYFGPSLKRLFSNKVYLLIILMSLVAVNGFIGMITFKPKFMEQVYGQSPSKAIFFIGRPQYRRHKHVHFLSFIQKKYFLQCDNSEVAGLTMSYQGKIKLYLSHSLLSQCNMGSSCSLKHWDPVCASNGIIYASTCLAGCQTSTGVAKEMEFHNCTCMGLPKWGLVAPPTNMSAILGQCPRKSDCDRMFKFYMAVSVLGACGVTSGYTVLLRSIHPNLKSLALGMQTLIVRTLGKWNPSPIYFGALIDRTCLKLGFKAMWGSRSIKTFLGLIYGLYGLSYLLWGVLYRQLTKRQKKLALRNQAKATALEANGNNNHNGHAMVSIFKNKDDLNRDGESTI
uniref:Solute carrier organic anion transporter family, member 1D1 n=1 Tax=Salmo trutta TaxID=8032 RepID=A0A674E665_SALTR